MDLIVVGAGLFGLTIAERAASAGKKVLVIDKRHHIGGNAYSEIDTVSGIEIHKYGSHIFHTSNSEVWKYANRFTTFNTYVHTVQALHRGRVYPLPINLATINSFFKKTHTPEEAKSLLNRFSSRPQTKTDSSLEEKAISLIGEELYEAFIRGYTLKQWQTDPAQLPAEIITRLPVRFNYNNRYFDDTWEGIPSGGYTKWFENMLDHRNIEVRLGVDFFDESQHLNKKSLVGQVPIVYTGPIDRYFNFSNGLLKWRTLDFEYETHNVQDYQGASVMNYSDEEFPFTRIHEFKHFNPEKREVFLGNSTIIAKEYSRFAQTNDEPYYPVNLKSDRDTLLQYRDLIKGEEKVYFGGRLGTYQYLDMHMAIASALNMSGKI
jgi:UDP-galactopyranose mutase